jgi:protein-S-isoprenylcysteine O-methyltransferase Ste14
VGGRTRPRKMGPFRPQIAGRNHDFRELSVPPLTEPGRQSGGSASFLPGVFAPHLSLGAAHPSHMRLLLALRALFFVLLLPGTVAGYIPFSILRAGNLLRVPDLGLASVCAAVFAITGALVLLRCVWDFFAAGKGTLAPIDPPRFLVVRGLYRFTRNPMYNGVVALILGEAWLFRSIGLAEYALLILIFFHLFVVLYEEPALESQFGESYRAYRRAVPRWGFTTRPFQESTGSTA